MKISFRAFSGIASAALLLFLFQNCSQMQSVQLTPSADENSKIVSNYYLQAMNQPGDGSSPLFQGQTGLYFWGASNLTDAVANGKPLENPAKKIADSGFQAIRLAIGTSAQSYGLTFPQSAAPTNLSAWLQVDEMRNTVLNPAFPLVALTTIDHASQGTLTNLARLKTNTFRAALFSEYFDFYSALYRLPVISAKTFIVSNWEGDNQIFDLCKAIDNGLMSAQTAGWIDKCSAKIENASGQTLNDSIDGFIIWNLIRKSALVAAKEQAPSASKVDIRFAIEFNQINMIPRSQSRSVLWDIVPIVKPDLVLYSSYESVTKNSLAADIAQVRQFLDSQQDLNKTSIAIGEIGQIGNIATQRESLLSSLKQVGLSDVAFSFVWNAFNQLAQFNDSSAESLGLWLPDGTLALAPTAGRLVPSLGSVGDVSVGCFSDSVGTCELSVTGNFPLYALNRQSAEIRCDGGGIIPISARFVTAQLIAVSLPPSVKNKNCRLRGRSDLGFASDWSNSFHVGVTAALPPAAGVDLNSSGYDIVIVAGQSNATNSGLGPRVDALEGLNDNRIDQLTCFDNVKPDFMLGPGELSGIITATDFVHDCEFNNPEFANDIVGPNRKGFAISFLRQYAKSSLRPNRRLLLIGAGASGTGSADWAANQPLLENVLDRTQAALAFHANSRVVAFLWSQGEADIFSVGQAIASNPPTLSRAASDAFISSYATTLTGIINRVRSRLGAERLPFLISEKAPQYALYQLDKLRYQDVDRWVVQNVGDALVVPANGLASNCQGKNLPCEDAQYVHFSAQANVDLGTRFYNAFQFLRPVVTPF